MPVKKTDDICRISMTVENMEKEIANQKSEVDRLEEFLRMDNLQMYRIPHSGDYEDYDSSFGCSQLSGSTKKMDAR